MLVVQKGFQWWKVLARARPSEGPIVASCRVSHPGKYLTTTTTTTVSRALPILNLLLLRLLWLEYHTLNFAPDFLLCVALNDVHK